MNRLNVQWTAKTLVNQMKRGNVNFDNAVQRGSKAYKGCYMEIKKVA